MWSVTSCSYTGGKKTINTMAQDNQPIPILIFQHEYFCLRKTALIYGAQLLPMIFDQQHDVYYRIHVQIQFSAPAAQGSDKEFDLSTRNELRTLLKVYSRRIISACLFPETGQSVSQGAILKRSSSSGQCITHPFTILLFSRLSLALPLNFSPLIYIIRL